MGCDIHYVFQVKTDDGWQDAPGMYEADRNYLTFTALANVRNFYDDTKKIPILASAKGYPEDFDVADGERHGGRWLGDHSHSFVTRKELAEFWAANKEALVDTEIAVIVYDMGRLSWGAGKYGRYLDVRMVFGFDS